MPSPFPGMDPYLEDPRLWPDVHANLVPEIQSRLSRQVRPRYVARIEDRVYVSYEDDPGRKVLIPDVHLVATEWPTRKHPEEDSGGVAVAEPIVARTMLMDEIHETYIEIVDASNREVVTVIEVLSPSNKCSGAVGQKLYLQKRGDVMRSSTHLVEIDLLRAGEREPSDPPPPRCDYLVHVSRAHERPDGTLWPILLEQRLPEIPVPLRREDPDARLDLQACLTAIYDRAGYDLSVEYGQPPDPPLTAEQADWANTLYR